MNNLDIAAIGNCSFGALIDRRARIAWTCLPRFDGDPVFCTLLNGHDGNNDKGIYEIELDDFARSEQCYQHNTAIVATTLYDTHGSVVEITDFAPRARLPSDHVGAHHQAGDRQPPHPHPHPAGRRIRRPHAGDHPGQQPYPLHLAVGHPAPDDRRPGVLRAGRGPLRGGGAVHADPRSRRDPEASYRGDRTRLLGEDHRVLARMVPLSLPSRSNGRKQ